jgi:hypothetical protein
VAKTLAEQIAEREFITRMSLAFNPNSIKLGNRRSLTAPRQLDSPVDVALRRFSESSPGSPYDLLATIPAAFAGIPGDVQGLAYMIAGGDTSQYKPPFPTTRDFQESIGVNPNTRMSLLGEFIDPIPGPSLAMGTGLIKKGGKKATTSGVGKKPSWWDDPSENAFAKGMTRGDVVEDWLARNKVPQNDEGKYVFYHATPKTNKLSELKEGTLLETDPAAARHFASRDRGIRPEDTIVHEVTISPYDIGGTTTWASLGRPYKLTTKPTTSGVAYPQLASPAGYQDFDALNRSSFIYDDVIPAEVPNSQRIVDVGTRLQDDALRVWGGKPMELNDNNMQVIARNMADEAIASFGRRPDMAGWYKANLDEAMQYASRIHPELATDPQSQTAFKFIMAITSNGQEVPLNAKLTNQYFDLWKREGRFPIAGSGKEKGAMQNSFMLANEMIGDMGFDGFEAFLKRDFTVRELRDAGFKIGGENLDTAVKGSAVFGPKIGSGFMQNLMGNFDTPTMDRWFVRTYGRHTGSLLAKPEKVAAQRQVLRDAIGRKTRFIKDLGFDPAEIKVSDEKLDELARVMFNRFSRDGFTDRSPLNNAARNLMNSVGNVVDAPTSGAQRQYIRQTMRHVQEEMARQGVAVDIADIQALLWYAEKDLYGKLGATVNTDTVDYATVWRSLADAVQ